MTIVILGAGEVGAALARQLAAADLVRNVLLVDDEAAVAAGKALDIVQAGAVDRYVTSVRGSGDLSAVVGAGVIVVADRVSPSSEWTGDAGLALLLRVAGYNQQAPILCAGAGQSSLVERGVTELGLSPTRIFGTPPEALRGAIIALTALEADASPGDVSLSVLGRAPHELIVPWDAAAIGGRCATDVLSPPALLRLGDRLPQLWPPGPATLGAAAARIIASMLTRAARTHAVLVAPGREEGARSQPAIMPARLGPGGILRLETPSLSSRDRTRLETALAR